MRHLFNTKLKIIIILAVLLTAVLAVMAGLTNRSVPELLVQVLLLAFTQNHTPLHDLIAHTVVVDYASQMIFDSPEALLRAKEEYHASLARSERY